MKRTTLPLLLTAVAAVLLAPSVALAWGPVVHLDLASRLLSGAVALSPAILALVRRFADDFLYGSLAADMVVGKNRAEAHLHCHSWSVARGLLDRARGHSSAREAFMLGYFSHLGADVIAHNHVVPQLMVEHYRKKGAGHIYWEVRADQRILGLRPELAAVWKDLSTRKFKEHDEFLRRELSPTLFSNRISAHIYGQSLNLQRTGPWRRAVKRIEDRSVWVMDQASLQSWRRLAAEAARKAVETPGSTRLAALDPTGAESLARAYTRRRSLRRKLRASRRDPSKTRILEISFKRAILEARQVDINLFEEDEAIVE